MTAEASPLAFSDEGEGWHLARRRRWVVRGICLLAVLACLGGAWWAVGRDAPDVTAFLVLLALGLLLMLPGRHSSADRAPRLVDTAEGRGLLLPERPASITSILAFACFTALALWLPYLSRDLYSSVGETTEPDAELAALALAVAVCAGAALLLLIATVAGLRSRLVRGRGILLLPDGMVLRVRGAAARVDWTAVRGVRAHWTRARGHSDALGTPDDLVQNWFTVEVERGDVTGRAPYARASRQPYPTLDVRLIGTDPDAALALCRFYRERPDRRGELSTKAAENRAVAVSPWRPGRRRHA